MTTKSPTAEEQAQFSIRAFKGIDVGLGKADSVADIAAKLEAQYPNHLIFVQAGPFLHGYDRTAYAMNVLKKYKLALVGTAAAPHIRIGFPVANAKRRLWAIAKEFDMPYVMSLGTKAADRDVYLSDVGQVEGSILGAVSEKIVSDVIADLIQDKQLNKAADEEALRNPEMTSFKFKDHAKDLDLLLTQDILNMPRDFRVVYGENIRACMARIMQGVFAYGLEKNRAALLQRLSADIDLLKHYISQAPRFSKLKFAFKHRARLAVDLGKLLGGVMRAAKEPA